MCKWDRGSAENIFVLTQIIGVAAVTAGLFLTWLNCPRPAAIMTAGLLGYFAAKFLR